MPVNADLSNGFKSIILETDQRKFSPFMRLLFLEEQQKYLKPSQNNGTYHPMNLDTDITYQTVNLFSSDKCFIYFISDAPHCIWWLNSIKVQFFFGKNIVKKHLCHHDKNYCYFCKSDISVINLIAGSRNMIKLSKDMSL